MISNGTPTSWLRNSGELMRVDSRKDRERRRRRRKKGGRGELWRYDKPAGASMAKQTVSLFGPDAVWVDAEFP